MNRPIPSITIVMYHYVRDTARSRYPRIKSRTIEEFEGQLDYIERHYGVCTTRDLLDAIRGDRVLPPNACLLTFDDGLLAAVACSTFTSCTRSWP